MRKAAENAVERLVELVMQQEQLIALLEAERDALRIAECIHPNNIKIIDKVSGEEGRRFKYCTSQRSGDWLGAYLTRSCGPQARWFVAKDEK